MLWFWFGFFRFFAVIENLLYFCGDIITDEMISGMKQMMITLLAMVLALPCVAQVNRLYMNDFDIEPDSTVTVSLYLTNEDPTRGLQ